MVERNFLRGLIVPITFAASVAMLYVPASATVSAIVNDSDTFVSSNAVVLMGASAVFVLFAGFARAIVGLVLAFTWVNNPPRSEPRLTIWVLGLIVLIPLASWISTTVWGLELMALWYPVVAVAIAYLGAMVTDLIPTRQ